MKVDVLLTTFEGNSLVADHDLQWFGNRPASHPLWRRRRRRSILPVGDHQHNARDDFDFSSGRDDQSEMPLSLPECFRRRVGDYSDESLAVDLNVGRSRKIPRIWQAGKALVRDHNDL